MGSVVSVPDFPLVTDESSRFSAVAFPVAVALDVLLAGSSVEPAAGTVVEGSLEVATVAPKALGAG